jgi:uncharacterized integral membrane protein
MIAAGHVPAIVFLRRASTMFRKIVSAVILVPLAAVIIIFAVANRQSVTVSFDPFSTTSPAYAVTLPLFVLIVVLIIFGVLIGGTVAWVGQARWRRAARRLDADVRALHQELDVIRRRFTPETRRAPDPAPYTVIPPPLP